MKQPHLPTSCFLAPRAAPSRADAGASIGALRRGVTQLSADGQWRMRGLKPVTWMQGATFAGTVALLRPVFLH
jgi:hypothetical protein